MSIETYEQIVETRTLDDEITEAEMEYTEGASLIDAKGALSSLRRKHLG